MKTFFFDGGCGSCSFRMDGDGGMPGGAGDGAAGGDATPAPEGGGEGTAPAGDAPAA